MDILDLAEEVGLNPTWKSATHGGEYCSPCPFCKEGDDRFLIWPKRYNNDGSYQGGRYQCPRHCGNYGDAINLLQLLHGLSYPDACARLKLTPKPRNLSIEPRPVPKPVIAVDPPVLWQQKALAFIEWSHNQLMRRPQAKQQVMRRGFTEESIKRFKIGLNSGNERGWDFYREPEEWGLEPELKNDGKPRKLWLPVGFTIPTFTADGKLIRVKVRRTAYEKEKEEYDREIAAGKNPKKKPRKYIDVTGSKKCLPVYGDQTLSCALIQESEFDSLLVQQEASDLCYCVALSGSTKPLDLHTDQLLRNTKTILFCPDYDVSGKIAWEKWKKMFSHVRRLLTPSEKSAGDAFLDGVDLREWLLEELNPKIRFTGTIEGI